MSINRYPIKLILELKTLYVKLLAENLAHGRHSINGEMIKYHYYDYILML
jgi:hypothetical protein